MALFQRAFPGVQSVDLNQSSTKFRDDQNRIISQFKADFGTQLRERRDLQALADVLQRAANQPNQHLHLPDPIFVKFNWHIDAVSAPIFNVYDALAVIHTLYAEQDRTATWESGTELPEIIAKYVYSLQSCCAIFARGVDSSKTAANKKQKESTSTVGFSVLKMGNSGSIASPDFGVSAAGNPATKKEIAKRRMQEIVKKEAYAESFEAERKKIGEKTGEKIGEVWPCGNCAEQMFWPRTGMPQTKYYALAFNNGKIDDWVTTKEACKNCQMLANLVMTMRGFEVIDRYEPKTEAQRKTQQKREEENRQAWDRIVDDGKLPNVRVPKWVSVWQQRGVSGRRPGSGVEKLLEPDAIEALYALRVES